ncbi:MAG: carboxypeptidase regulatory-like domain-containing protein [Proteobacteria bacterium]|nr:carboxypeptidase regulatory-like domain-containing protein [Pseudomonadota bacterium]
MIKIYRTLAVCTILLVFAFTGLNAQQTTGTISGVVSDETGGVLPGVDVTARNTGTEATRTVISDDEGRYRLSQLSPGDYELRAELAGFQTAILQDISLSVAQGAVIAVGAARHIGVRGDKAEGVRFAIDHRASERNARLKPQDGVSGGNVGDTGRAVDADALDGKDDGVRFVAARQGARAPQNEKNGAEGGKGAGNSPASVSVQAVHGLQGTLLHGVRRTT